MYIYACCATCVYLPTLLVPSAAPQVVEVTALSSTSAYLSWISPPLEHHNGEITGYVINVTGSETQQFTSESTNVTIFTLEPFTVFSFTIAARTSAGTGPFSSPVTLQTLEDGTYARLGDNSVESVTFSFLSMQLQVPLQWV